VGGISVKTRQVYVRLLLGKKTDSENSLFFPSASYSLPNGSLNTDLIT